MSTSITLREYAVIDHIAIDHGDKAVSLTIFNGKVQVGAPGWANSVEFTPEQAEDIAVALQWHANELRNAADTLRGVVRHE